MIQYLTTPYLRLVQWKRSKKPMEIMVHTDSLFQIAEALSM